MAKVPETVNQFKLVLLLHPDQLGSLLEFCELKGIPIPVPELVTNVITFKGKSSPGETLETIMGWTVEHPTFKAIDVCRHFESLGRTRGPVYPGLAVLVKKGQLKKIAPGEYARADQKALPAPAKKAKILHAKKLTAKPIKKFFDKSGADVVLSYAKRNHGRFNTTKLIEVFEADGRAKNSVYASINELVATKLAKRVGKSGSGSYVLLQKAVTAKAAPKHAHRAKPAVNGAAPIEAAPVMEVSDHG